MFHYSNPLQLNRFNPWSNEDSVEPFVLLSVDVCQGTTLNTCCSVRRVKIVLCALGLRRSHVGFHWSLHSWLNGDWLMTVTGDSS